MLIVLPILCIALLARPRSRRVRGLLVSAVAWYAVISIYPIPYVVGKQWARAYPPLQRSDVPPGSTAVVVLGSGAFTAVDWTRGRAAVPDPFGLDRILEAARVFKLIDPAWVVCSGGVIDPDTFNLSIGETMKATIVGLGVPAARVVVEDAADDTHDEAVNMATLLPTLHVDHVVLVTSLVHMPRAAATFRAIGIPVIPAPARDFTPDNLSWSGRFLPSQMGLIEASQVGHELLGYLYYRLRGWR